MFDKVSSVDKIHFNLVIHSILIKKPGKKSILHKWNMILRTG